MIEVAILKHAKKYRGFIIKGHSGYEENGRDIICSAVSALSVNTVNSLEKLALVFPKVEQKDGYLSCTFLEELNREGILLMDSMLLGMQTIFENYGKTYIQIRFEEV